MSNPASDPNAENSTLDAAADLRENMKYIKKFGLPPNVAQHIDSRLILNDAHIDDPTIASDIELNSYVLQCLESYQLSQSLVVDYMLEIFREEFHGWGYTEFSRLDQNIRGVLKETLMAKGIYMGRPSDHINQHLANLVIDEQFPIWDKNDLRKYKKIYPTSKAWILLESEFDSPVPQQLTPSIKPNINLIDYRRQQTITSRPAQIGSIPLMRQETITPRPAHIGSIPPMRQITPDPVNALSSTPPTEAPLAQIPLVQAPPTPEHPIQVPTAQVLPIQVSPAQVLPIPAATVQAPLSVPLALSPPAEHGHGQPEMHPEQVKIVSDKIGTFTNKHADAQLSASGQKEIQGFLERDVFKVVTPNKVVKPEEVPSSTQVFDFRFIDDIKDLCTDKAHEKSRPVVHAYKNEKKNLVLMHLSKLPGVSQGIGSCLAAIIRDGDNKNTRFYLREITQAYVEIAFAIYHPHYKEKPGLQNPHTNISLEGWVKR